MGTTESPVEPWTTSRIIAQVEDSAAKQRIALAFWTGTYPLKPDPADQAAQDKEIKTDQAKAVSFIAQRKHFRPFFVEKWPAEKKASAILEFQADLGAEWIFKRALLLYHFNNEKPLLRKFLEEWNIPNENGNITGSPPSPSVEAIRAAASKLREKFNLQRITLYLASAGLLMPDWREQTWIVANELALEVGPPAGVAPKEPREEPTAGSEWQAKDFTTLDQVIIKSIISSVGQFDGSLSTDQVMDLVQEIIHQNPDRQRSYFHCGFLFGLCGKTLEDHELELNGSRRAWLLAGEICAYSRKKNYAAIVKIFTDRRTDYDELKESREGCAVLACPIVFRVLAETGHYGDAVHSVTPELAAQAGNAFLYKILAVLKDLLRFRRPSDSRVVIDLLEGALRFGWKAPASLRIEFERRRAIYHRTIAQFAKCESMLSEMLKQFGEEVSNDVYPDLGLTKGSFSWPTDVIVPARQDDVAPMIARLEAGENDFRRPLSGAHGNHSLQVHYPLGVLELLRKNYRKARAHLELAETDALRKIDLYRSTRLYYKIKAYYGMAILLDMHEPQFGAAVSHLCAAIEGFPAAEWPKWLLRDAAKIVLFGYDDSLELLGLIRQYFHDLVDDFIHNGDLVMKSPALVDTLRIQMVNKERKMELRWEDGKTLLGYYRSSAQAEEASEVLDVLENLAHDHPELRGPFLQLILDPTNVDPIWDSTDARFAMAGVMELVGDYETAAEIFKGLFHEYCGRGELDEARGIIDRIAEYGLPDMPDDAMNARLRALYAAIGKHAATSPQEAAPADALISALEQSPLTVLFFGGDEKETAYDAEIFNELKNKFPGLSVEFIHSGWNSGWPVHLEEFKRRMEKSDVAVLSRCMRTTLGIKVRKHLSVIKKPWRACTGRGRGTIMRAIENAARDIASLRQSVK